MLNSPKSDEFTFFLSEYLNEHNPGKKKTSIKELWEYFDVEKLKVHSKIVTGSRKNSKKDIGEFMSRKVRVEVVEV